MDAYLLATEMLECCVRENSRHEEEQSLGFRGREQTKKKKLLSPRVNREHSKEIKQRRVLYINKGMISQAQRYADVIRLFVLALPKGDIIGVRIRSLS